MLQGRVYHRLTLSIKDDIGDRKRQKVSSNSSPGDATNGAQSRTDDGKLSPEAGLYFVVEHEKNRSSSVESIGSGEAKEFLLSVPQHLIKMVCDAARFEHAIQVSNYRVISLARNDDYGDKQRKRTFPERDSPPNLLEIYHGGLHAVSSKDGRNKDFDSCTFMSLAQVFDHETEVEKEEVNEKKTNKQKQRKHPPSPRYNLKATVDSISPIIFMGKPFALMELYDNESSTPCSCVVVFQGRTSLTCHAGLIPGDEIMLRQTKRQRWKIPEEVMHRNAIHLKHRVPTHVFVLKDANDIGWQYPNGHDTIMPLSVPSSPVPLASLQGRIVSREWASRGSSSAESSKSKSYIIHSIELQPNQHESSNAEDRILASPARYILFLTYFPMGPSLTLSLRPGALVQAANIHFIGSATNGKLKGTVKGGYFTYYYGACLRSTLSILEMAPKEHHPESLYKYYPSRPYAFLPIGRSYMEYFCRKELYEWFHTTCDFLKCATSDFPIPTFDEIAKQWWECYNYKNDNNTPQKASSRNPYIEFFDHACDADEDVEHDIDGLIDKQNAILESPHCVSTCVQRAGCHASISDSTTNETNLPQWVSLSELRQNSVIFFKLRLKRALQQEKANTQPPMGWTASICLSNVELLEAICGHGKSINGAQIYTGGFLVQLFSSESSVNHGFKSASFSDGRCILPATVALLMRKGSQESTDQCHEAASAATFGFGRLDSVIVSCMCLGAAPGLLEDLSTQAGTDADKDDSEKSDFKQSDSSVTNPYTKKLKSRRDVADMLCYKDEIKNTCQKNQLQGACSLVQAEGHLFVVSIQLRFDTLVPCLPNPAAEATRLKGESHAATMATNANDERSFGRHQPSSVTVQQCLDPEALGSTKHDLLGASILGCLARRRFRLAKIASNQYRGLVITISHIPISQAYGNRECIQGDLSCIQSIDVKTVIDYKNTTEKRDFLKKWMEQLVPRKTFIGDDLTAMALAWWRIADDAQRCALTAGGLDDCCLSELRSAHSLCATVQIPFASTLNEEPRGYKRFLCHMGQLRATITPLSVPANTGSATKKSHALLDSIGGFKVLPGMLDQRPRRRLGRADFANNTPAQLHLCRPKVTAGELTTLPPTSQSGIPHCSLGDMLRFLCMDLQSQRNMPTKNANLAPSLVRNIRGAQFLGASFCQAQAVCQKCFQPLCQGNTKNGQHAIARQQPGGSKGKSNDSRTCYKQDGGQQPSFWHCPLPIPGYIPSGTSSAGATSKSARLERLGPNKGNSQTLARRSSGLCCPNGCHVETYGEIKWECSGLLDDGKAQAKLYAEREAGTLLLGMCQSTIDMIEEGVWKNKSGSIAFTKTAPPPPHLAKAIEGANFMYMAQKHRQQSKQKIIRNTPQYSEEKGVLEFLGPVDRATYLMYQHCRHSREVTRPLDYLVRCKPLADHVLHLNHTDFEVVTPGPREGTPLAHNVAAYSLPPLKLNLVDCCSAASSRTSVVEDTWDLVQAMNIEEPD